MDTKSKEIKNIATILIVIILVALIFIAGMGYSSDSPSTGAEPTPPPVSGTSPTPTPTPTPTQAAAPVFEAFTVRAEDAPKGNGPYLLIEYSDYECPFCKRFHPVVQQLVDDGEVTWIYRHFPLEEIHPTADEGALIGECVRIHKGARAFWTYTDSVFAAEKPSLTLYRSLAKSAGLSDTQVDACLQSNSAAAAVLKMHKNDASILGVNGTPGSFLVNPKTGDFERIPGALPLDGDDRSPGVRDLLTSLKEKSAR